MSVDEYKQPPENYRPEDAPETSYQKAGEEWDRRIGDARAQAKNWRLLALGLVAANILLVAGIIYQSTKSTVKPYVVEVGREGDVRAIGPAEERLYVPGKPVIDYFMAQWINWVRSIPTDAVVARDNWLKAYAYLRQGSATKLNAIVQREQPLARIGLEMVSVQVKNVIPLSKNTYQVRWEETTYSKEGAITGMKRLTGAFTIEFAPPTSEAELRKNPLGLYISDFSWSTDVS